MSKFGRIAAGFVHLWKGEMKIARMAPFSSSTENANRPIGRAWRARKQIATRSSIFEKLNSVMGETLDFIIREEEKKTGVSVTKVDLIGWAEQLDKDGKHEYALEIFEWMDKKKMEFSPSEHAHFVDLLAKTKGYPAAEEYFMKIEPDFDENDRGAKNQPAFRKLVYWLREVDKKSMQSQWLFAFAEAF